MDYYEDGTDGGVELTQGGYSKRVKLSHYETVTLVANTPFVITHNLSSVRVSVTIYDATTGEQVHLEASSRTSNTISITSSISGNVHILIQK